MLGLSAAALSCSDDDGAGTSPGFESIATSVYEADGDESITVMFRDGSVSEADLIIDGTATEGDDYTITGVSEEGITFQMLDDNLAEGIETIRIRIKGASGEANRIHNVRILSDDPGFLAITLDWPGAPDMDLHLFHRSSPEDTWHAVDFSDPGELELDWTAEDGEYGLAYNYYSGSVDPLNFTVTFDPSGADNITLDGDSDNAVFNATYHLANRNAAANAAATKVVQTFTKTGVDYHDFSTITVPATGSRQGSSNIAPTTLGKK